MLESRFQTKTEPLLIDRRLFEAWFAGTKIPLTATEYDLRALPHEKHERVLSRSEILEQVWGDGRRGHRVVDTYVSSLRTKLKTGDISACSLCENEVIGLLKPLATVANSCPVLRVLDWSQIR